MDARNVCTLTNNGSSRAYPVFTVQGPWPSGVQLTFPGLGMSLDYAESVGNVPLVLDSRSRTASIGGGREQESSPAWLSDRPAGRLAGREPAIHRQWVCERRMP